jgi:hypothetical protein
VKTATFGVTTLALSLLASPAAATNPGSFWWMGQPGYPLFSQTEADVKNVGPAPQWWWWSWGWDFTNKTEVASWPTFSRREPDLRLMPPKQYDHPYSGPGVLLIIPAASQNEVREWCPDAVFPKAGAYGCAQMKGWGCRVVIAPVADMKAVGLTKDMVVRHEVAHCNGWPNHHPGALPVEDWAVDMSAYDARQP